jgi:hypothetical protein
MHCSIPTLNTALVFTLIIHGDLTPSHLERRASLLGNYIKYTIPFLRRIIYKAKMTARPMQVNLTGKLDIAKHKS